MKAQLYQIEGPWPGHLAIVPRPRGGDWLEDEVRAWRAEGIDTVVSALDADEVEELALEAEATECRANEIDFVSYPIADRGVPESTRRTVELAQWLERKLAGGRSVAIHCRQGVGRSALLAGSLLVLGGMTPAAAFERIGAARGCSVPDTREQRDWLGRFGREALAAPESSRIDG